MSDELKRVTKILSQLAKVTTGEVRVHISNNWWEPDPMASALKIFKHYKMDLMTHENAVLIYLNPRKQKFAFLSGAGLDAKVGRKYWEELAIFFESDLRSTHYENALLMAINTLAATLNKYYPI